MAIHSPKYLIQFLTLTSIFLSFSSSFKTYTTLNQGSSLSSPGEVLVSSPSRIFTAGFYRVGDNAYYFAIWFTHALADGNVTVVWMANRDQPVNGKNTKLSLTQSGNLVLHDAGLLSVWTSASKSASAVALHLHDSGDLVLRDETNATVIWRSFDSPTDTLLPQQQLTKNANLISPRSLTNHSSGFYKLYFDNDNVLRLLYNGAEITSVFWPSPWLNSWEAGRSSYNTSKIAMLDAYGEFTSTDDFKFRTSDFGVGPRRRMTLDVDGLVRVYSLNKDIKMWEVTWQLPMLPCHIHGICGANGLCTYSPRSGRRCACLKGYKIKNGGDWSEGCVPDFDETNIPCRNDTTITHNSSSDFLNVRHAEFYGYDIGFFRNQTLEECENRCLSNCNCRGFQYRFDWVNGTYNCYPKTILFNGYQSSEFNDLIYVRLPKHYMSLLALKNETKSLQFEPNCTNDVVEIQRPYKRRDRYGWFMSLVWCVGALGVVEVACVLIFLLKTHRSSNKLRDQGYFQVATGFRRFTYAEMKKATRNFSEEIGRGGSGVVYKGVLPDSRIAAIKCLNEASQGEEEFLAEVSLIGRLNHANLIERWGYCAEGKHRLLVYEYMENGSLAQNLTSANKLDWKKRFEIALGTAKGLAYLHEECLEWVLHCDVKPHNILLDQNYKPKVADFGLCKQVQRSNVEKLNVSAIRGTRGYMAPEWVYNLPITAKVDVYSYGVVLLEMVTGKSVTEINSDGKNGGILGRHGELDEESSSVSSWIEHISDPAMGGEYDVDELENLVKVALQCAHENRDARPTMTQVVHMFCSVGTVSN